MIYIYIYNCSHFIVLYPLFTVDLTQALNNCRERPGGGEGNAGEHGDPKGRDSDPGRGKKGRVPLRVGYGGRSVREEMDS